MKILHENMPKKVDDRSHGQCDCSMCMVLAMINGPIFMGQHQVVLPISGATCTHRVCNKLLAHRSERFVLQKIVLQKQAAVAVCAIQKAQLVGVKASDVEQRPCLVQPTLDRTRLPQWHATA